ncbi:hypothetical protein BB558_002100 [Smittium angustum]|uniref:Protoheme IX farnesyltransferase, mitochondrial n=1 Tax=Smittium angustum TaxID=133377 RepID=A0A2U1J9L8_SMIAN|nr:hypothetical protein BB558_002100 [Smittium angustum]
MLIFQKASKASSLRPLFSSTKVFTLSRSLLTSKPKISTLFPPSSNRPITPLSSLPNSFPFLQPKNFKYTTTPSPEKNVNSPPTELPLKTHSSSLVWKIQRPLPPVKKFYTYMDLSKDKLTAFVVLTAMAGYAAAPLSADLKTLFVLTTGTAMCSAAANATNQWIEVPYDAQMKRTRNRPIVRGAVPPTNAISFAIAMGALGTTSLIYFVNPITGFLGLLNIVLYSFVYTPLKRISVVNTWIGAFVGAIPPMMGWTAATGSFDLGTLLLGGLLFAWQFPHFNSLSWTLRKEYSVAGYRMISVLNPPLNSRVSLRYSIAMFPICGMLTYFQITDSWFLLDSSVVNAYLTYQAYGFWKSSNSTSSRSLFFASLIHLPLILILLIAHKKRASEDSEPKQLETPTTEN